MPRASLKRLLLVGGATIGLGAATVFTGIGVLFVTVRRDFEQSLSESVLEQIAADEIVTAVYGQLVASYRQLQFPTDVNRQRFDSLGGTAYAGLRTYLFRPMDLESRTQVETIRELHAALEVEAHRAFDLVKRGERVAARNHIERMERDAANLEAAMDKLVALRARDRAVIRDGQSTLVRRAAVGVALVVAGIAAFALLFIRVVSRRVMRPLGQLSDAAMQLGGGDLSARMPAQRDAELVGVAKSFNDMAARIREATLARDHSEAQYQRLFDDAPIPLYRTSPDGTILNANPAFAALLGFPSVRAVLGADVHGWYVRQDDREHFVRTIERDGVIRDQVIQLRKADGAPIWVLDTTTRISAPASGDVFYEGGLLDISERLRMEGALRESDDRFREMAAHINEAFFIVDLESGRSLYVSPTWSVIWGRSIADAYNPEVWLAGIHQDDRAVVVASQERVKAGQSDESVFRVIRPDGSTRWVRGRVFPVRNADGRVYRMVGVSEDITILRQAEERFAQAQKMEAVGRLAGGVAHDFNNLLTVILAEAEMAQSTLAPDDPQREGLSEIRRACDSAVLLTQQLLAFSRKQLVEPVVFKVNDAVADTAKMLGRLIGEDVKLEIRLGHGSGSVRADRGQIQQVLTNLAVNARDAMPTGGVLAIETSEVELDDSTSHAIPDLTPGRYTLLSVSDTGCGMSEEVRARAFEPFFTTKETGKGTGLGLATSHGIIRQAGGNIVIYSQLNIGTTIRIYLPRVDDAAPSPSTVSEPVHVRGTETILVAEDEPDVRRVGVRILRGLGYNVLEANNGTEALRLLREHTGVIHLLFTDVVMPEMGGRDLSDFAHSLRPELKVLFTTGYTDDVILRHRLTEQHVSVLQKPYSRESLAEKIRSALDDRG